MKHYLRNRVNKINAKEQRRQQEKLASDARNKEEEFRKMLSKIMGGVYVQTEKAVNKHVTSALDRKALMEALDKVFGKKKEDSKIERI